MKMRLILTAFIAIFLGLMRGKPSNQASSHSEVKENIRDLFNSIQKSDAKNIDNVRKILKQEAVREQQAFDTAKDELRLARQKLSVYKQKHIEHLAVFKREPKDGEKPGDTTTSTPSSNQITTDNVEDNDDGVVHSEELRREMKDLDGKTVQQVRAAAKPILRAKIKAEKENKILSAKLTAKEIELHSREKDLLNVSELYEKEKWKCAAFELLLGVRMEIEHQLMDALYPKTFPKTKSQFFKCLFVLTMQEGRMVDTYRSIVREANFTIREFCYLAHTEIYDPKSVIVHSTDIPDHCLTLENYLAIIQEDVRLAAFIKEGHRRKDLISTILKLRTARLTQTGELGTSDSPDNSNRCILMSNVKLGGNRNIPETQIKSAFKATAAKDGLESICETRKSYVKRSTIGDVLINFIMPVHAASAMLEHLQIINGQKVHLLLVDCMDVECSENKWSSHPLGN